MKTTAQLAKHFREVHSGGNWTSSNLRDSLTDLSWQEATMQVGSLNTIAILVYHINYYVSAVLKVLEGETLDAHDKYSFDCPPVHTQEDWEKLKEKTFRDAEKFAARVEALPETELWENLSEEKYGNYYRNILGIIEHTHYHLGQIVLLKKILRQAAEKEL